MATVLAGAALPQFAAESPAKAFAKVKDAAFAKEGKPYFLLRIPAAIRTLSHTVEELPKTASDAMVTRFTVESEYLAKGKSIHTKGGYYIAGFSELFFQPRKLAKGKTWTLHHVVECQAEN